MTDATKERETEMNDTVKVKDDVGRQLKELDAQIEDAEAVAASLRQQRNELIDQVALQATEFKVGDRVKTRNGKRYQITKIHGDYWQPSDLLPEARIWVRYTASQVKADGALSLRTKGIYEFERADTQPTNRKDGRG